MLGQTQVTKCRWLRSHLPQESEERGCLPMTAQDRRCERSRLARSARTDDRIVGPTCRHPSWSAYQSGHGRIDEVARIEAEAECEAPADFRQQMRPQGDDKIVESDMAEPHNRQFGRRPEGIGCVHQVISVRKPCFGTDKFNRCGSGALPVGTGEQFQKRPQVWGLRDFIQGSDEGVREDHSTPRRACVVERPREHISVSVGKAAEEWRPLGTRGRRIREVEALNDSGRHLVVSARRQHGVSAATFAVQSLFDPHGPYARCCCHEWSARSFRIGSVRSAERVPSSRIT